MTKKNTPKEKAWFAAIKNDSHPQVKKMALEDRDLLLAYDYGSFGATPLNLVASSQRKKMADLLLDLGADPNRKSDWPMGPWNPVQLALNHGDEKVATYLISKGAEVGVHEAAGLKLSSHLEEILQSNPEKVHEQGGDGCTALHFAGSERIVDILLEYGADINARDVDHHSTPAQYLAKSKPAITKYLFKRGAEADISSATNFSISFI